MTTNSKEYMKEYMRLYRFQRPEWMEYNRRWRREHFPAGSAYNSWYNMKTRCNNPNHDSYPNYGGRGITYCKRWESYKNFLEDMGPRPPGTTIDRIDPDGNYEPGNCRWSTPKEQIFNRRRG
jgi:hypothetical protein